jgi:N-carbamoylputrescine amidase
MAGQLKIALVQQHASPDTKENIDHAIHSVVEAANSGAKLVSFAELAFTRFYPQHPASGDVLHLAEPVPGPTTEIFSGLAKKLGIVIVLNLYEGAGEHTFDSSPVIDSDGAILGVTRMVHIIEAACFHEQGYYTPGDRGAPVYDTSAGKICVAICYDRHYPEYMRALALNGAELVIVPQAGTVGEWPHGLFEAELQVASFQNGYFSALCNRVGKEDVMEFEGKSFVTAPDGRIIAQASAGEDEILYADIDLAEVRASHAQRHFLRDRRPELYGSWFK